jgi:ABC-type proline/glycine betaine transport system permease subunit
MGGRTLGSSPDGAALDIRNPRSMPYLLRPVRLSAVQTICCVVTAAILLALPAGAAIEPKIFGQGAWPRII